MKVEIEDGCGLSVGDGSREGGSSNQSICKMQSWNYRCVVHIKMNRIE